MRFFTPSAVRNVRPVAVAAAATVSCCSSINKSRAALYVCTAFYPRAPAHSVKVTVYLWTIIIFFIIINHFLFHSSSLATRTRVEILAPPRVISLDIHIYLSTDNFVIVFTHRPNRTVTCVLSVEVPTGYIVCTFWPNICFIFQSKTTLRSPEVEN
jgi:hypothetical protein